MSAEGNISVRRFIALKVLTVLKPSCRQTTSALLSVNLSSHTGTHCFVVPFRMSRNPSLGAWQG